MSIFQVTRLKIIVFLLIFFSFALPVGTVYAETQYVSDTLIITVREGKGNEYKSIETLKTNAPLEVIEKSDHYLKVRTEKGNVGWVHRQYATRKTPKPEIIAGQKIKIAQLSARVEQYKKDTGSLQEELKTTRLKIKDLKQNVSASKGEAEQTARELEKITAKYNALFKDSEDVIDLVKERDTLKASNSSFQTETAQLLEENEKLKFRQMIWWFFAGGGVFFVGWIVGKISRQKRFY